MQHKQTCNHVWMSAEYVFFTPIRPAAHLNLTRHLGEVCVHQPVTANWVNRRPNWESQIRSLPCPRYCNDFHISSLCFPLAHWWNVYRSKSTAERKTTTPRLQTALSCAAVDIHYRDYFLSLPPRCGLDLAFRPEDTKAPGMDRARLMI